MSEETKEVAVKEEEEKLTPEQAERIEKDFMEDGEPLVLYDRVNKEKLTYIIPPLLLKDAKKLMRLLKTIDIDFVIINLVPDEDTDTDKSDDLYEALLLGFRYNYPEMTAERLEDICNLKQAKELINIMIGINGLKK